MLGTALSAYLPLLPLLLFAVLSALSAVQWLRAMRKFQLSGVRKVLTATALLSGLSGALLFRLFPEVTVPEHAILAADCALALLLGLDSLINIYQYAQSRRENNRELEHVLDGLEDKAKPEAPKRSFIKIRNY